MNLLAFDIGNTNIVVGYFADQKLEQVIRIKTDSSRTADEYSFLMRGILSYKLDRSLKIDSAIISSVVPPITPEIVSLVRNEYKIDPLVVDSTTDLGIGIGTEDPRAVGADRIVNSVACVELYGTPGLVIDFGTATTFDVISSDKRYVGGIIAPGVGISLDALVQRTAKLPRIEIAWPKRIVGTSTVTAMQSGAVAGYGCMIEGLIRKLKEECGDFKVVVATGGLGAMFAEKCNGISLYDEQLTLKGLQIIAVRNLAR